MNGYGRNLDRKLPDMLEYWNFFLANEMLTITRQKYTWLDNIAFLGGIIDFFVIGLGLMFWIYNYEIGSYKLCYQHHKSKLQKKGRKDNKITKQIETWHLFFGPYLLIYDIYSLLKSIILTCMNKN